MDSTDPQAELFHAVATWHWSIVAYGLISTLCVLAVGLACLIVGLVGDGLWIHGDMGLGARHTIGYAIQSSVFLIGLGCLVGVSFAGGAGIAFHEASRSRWAYAAATLGLSWVSVWALLMAWD